MYRRGGSIALALGGVLMVLFLVWPAHYQTGYIRSSDEVSRVYVTCGVPWSILTERRFSNQVRTPWIQEQCVKTSRTRLLNIAVFSVPLVALGVIGLTRGRYRRVPLTTVLRPLPKQLWWQRRRHMNQELSRDRQTENRAGIDSGGQSPEGTPPI